MPESFNPAAVAHEGYRAEVLEKVENGPGRWDYLRVGVFQGPALLGEYLRNYSSLQQTFHPFRREGVWYALCSASYTATQVMRLPECQLVGGEEPSANGFCPVEFWVPAYRVGQVETAGPQEAFYVTESDLPSFWDPQGEEGELGEVRYLPFGFVLGCHWGGEYGVQLLDLRDPLNPRRMPELGFFETPAGLSLPQAVRIQHMEGEGGPEDVLFDIAVRKRVVFQQEAFAFRFS